MERKLKGGIIIILCVELILSQKVAAISDPTTGGGAEESIPEPTTGSGQAVQEETSTTEGTIATPAELAEPASAAAPAEDAADNTSANSTSGAAPTNANATHVEHAPEHVATFERDIANSESDELAVTTAACAYFDEKCRASAEEKPDCSQTTSGGDLKPCDTESHLECSESVRHNYQMTCHCKPGTIKNPYDKHRCIPKQNHIRQWGDSCIAADDEKCDSEKFLRCVPNAEQKEDDKGKVPSHICACVEDKFIDVKVVNETMGMSECYINRTDKYMVPSTGYKAAPAYWACHLNRLLLQLLALIKFIPILSQ